MFCRDVLDRVLALVPSPRACRCPPSSDFDCRNPWRAASHHLVTLSAEQRWNSSTRPLSAGFAAGVDPHAKATGASPTQATSPLTRWQESLKRGAPWLCISSKSSVDAICCHCLVWEGE